MPEEKTRLAQEEGQEKWITVGGRRVKIEAGQDPQEAIREKLPSVGGEKAKNTKEGMQKNYFQRYSVFKSIFESRDEVTWDKYTKFGKIAGYDGSSLLILDKYGDIVPVHKDYVFKVNEITAYGHWDALSDTDRANLLKELNLDISFMESDYVQLPDSVKKMLKDSSPAGYDMGAGGMGTGVQGKVNPVSNEVSVSDRIRNEISRRAQTAEATPPKILDEGQESKFEQNEVEQGHNTQEEQTEEGQFNPVYGEPKDNEQPVVGEGNFLEGGQEKKPEVGEEQLKPAEEKPTEEPKKEEKEKPKDEE